MTPYLNKNSILTRLDPRLKIVVTFLLIIATLFASNWIVLSMFLVFVFALVMLLGIPMLYCFEKLKSPSMMIVIMLILQILMTSHGNVIFEIGFIQITDDAIFYGLLVFARLMIVMMSTIVLTSTTMPREFILSLESFLTPVEKLGLKIGPMVLAFRIIQRFVPNVFKEAKKILNAQASRGLDIKGANISMKMRLIGALLLPVFVISIKRADELSNSMAVRGYMIDGKRTSLHSLKGSK